MSPDESGEWVNLAILTCESVLYEGPVRWVEMPLSDGLIGIWPGHVPLVARLGEGALRYQDGGAVHDLPVNGGILHVSTEFCAVLLTSASEQPGAERDNERLFSTLESALLEMWNEEQWRRLQEEQRGDDELDSVAADRSGE